MRKKFRKTVSETSRFDTSAFSLQLPELVRKKTNATQRIFDILPERLPSELIEFEEDSDVEDTNYSDVEMKSVGDVEMKSVGDIDEDGMNISQ
jgi:hypothetical protein